MFTSSAAAATAAAASAAAAAVSCIPSLRLRKDIWTHFPVCLVKLPVATDGRDRYAIQWHQKNLTEWSQGIPQYPVITQVRLLKALKACEKWTIEKPAAPGDLCVIAMNVDRTPKSDVSSSELPLLFEAPERVSAIETLRTYLPVCWKSKHNRYTLEFHNTLVRALSLKHCITEPEVKALTVQKLQYMLAPSWEIQRTHKVLGNEICTVWKKSEPLRTVDLV